MTEYKFNEVQQKVKVVKKVKVLTVVKRVSKAVAGRRERIQKFGDAKECEDESNVRVGYHRVLGGGSGGGDVEGLSDMPARETHSSSF